jgi:4-alpha-glucanotransferase
LTPARLLAHHASMNLQFRIHYHTQWGQTLRVTGSLPTLGADDPDRAACMDYTADGNWILGLDVPDDTDAFHYAYLLCDARDNTRRREFGAARACRLEAGGFARAELVDAWRPADDPANALLTSAFTRVLMRRPPRRGGRRRTPAGDITRFQVYAPRVGRACRLCILGSDPALGAWNVRRAVKLDDRDFPLWRADVPIERHDAVLHYKYAILDAAGRIVTWEEGGDRAVRVGPAGAGLTVRTDNAFRYPVGNWKGAGVAVPVFALRGAQSLGVGEFADMKPLVDWAVKTGLKMIQVLPVNDSIATHTWQDSYPYAAVSVFALHPIYMNLEAMGIPRDRVPLDATDAARERLNALPEVDVEAVMRVKSRYFKQAYDAVRETFLRDRAYKAFFARNRDWLVPYAAFSCLRDRFGTPDHTAWPSYARFDADAIAAFCAPDQPHYDDVAVHYFIQYHLHRQLADAAAYARERGVVLKGDIPIGVYRHSVDTWVEPGLFHMDRQAGAPPDAFSADGQNWKFPTYNWPAMARDGYAWWRRRFAKMADTFDAFRIDHILGFFRIWEIPADGVDGMQGRFNPSLPFTIEELQARIPAFEQDRFCRPYIRQAMLDARFGEDADAVARTYLDAYAPGCYAPKPEYATQRAVAEALGAGADVDRIRRGLFDLLNDVLFLEAPGSAGRAFNPRHTFHRTESYRALDDGTRAALDALYIEYFYRRHETFWREQAMIKLPAILAGTGMLVCGEDLGMAPDCVPGVMQELSILGLWIQRMPKSRDREFEHPADYPYLSVASPSTHDMATFRGWWEEDRARAQRFYNQILGHWGGAPYFAEPWVCRAMVEQHLHAPSMWAVFPIQDLLAMDAGLRRERPEDERINVPSNPEHYWRYRMHRSLDALLDADAFNRDLRELVTAAGRNAPH